MGPSAQLLETARAVHKDNAQNVRRSSENNSAMYKSSAERSLNTYQDQEDPRTIMQIKRSRVDLEKRYVFLCPTSLNKHFDSIPPEAKQKCLLVFKCTRDWVIPSSTEQTKTVSPRIVCWDKNKERKQKLGEPNRMAKPWQSVHELSRDFVTWVIHKEREGAVFWFKPDRDLSRLSEFFEQHMDPVTGAPYQPLLLDPSWWRVKFMRTCAKYVHNPAKIVACIQQLMEEEERRLENERLKKDPPPSYKGLGDLDVPALQELLYQSNPTLEPIAKWPHAPSMRYTPKTVPPVQTDFVGKETTYKGYVDHDQSSGRHAMDASLPVGVKCMREGNRIDDWPVHPTVRLDNLHTRWQLEDSVSHRHESLALSLRPNNRGAMTAREVLGSRGGYGSKLPPSRDSQYCHEAAAAVRSLRESNQISNKFIMQTASTYHVPIGAMLR